MSTLGTIEMGLEAVKKELRECLARIEDLRGALLNAWDENAALTRRCEAAERENATLREQLGTKGAA